MILCEFKKSQEFPIWLGPYPYVIINGRSLHVGKDMMQVAFLNANGLWEVREFKTVFNELKIYCDDDDLDIRPTFYRGIGRASLFGNFHRLLYFFHDVFFAKGDEKLAKFNYKFDVWRLEQDEFKSIQITTSNEPQCPVCGNVFSNFMNNYCQCKRCLAHYEINPYDPTDTHVITSSPWEKFML
jgi:hypothetical protein